MAAHNMLIIMSDEHTRSVMGAYGNPLAHTPALDDLAAIRDLLFAGVTANGDQVKPIDRFGIVAG